MMILKLVSRAAWLEACREGNFHGSADDLRDGFIHLSAPEQVRATAARHFQGTRDVLLVAFAEATFGDRLKWEPSRGGELFPHLYGPLPTALALWSEPLAADADGTLLIPQELVPC